MKLSVNQIDNYGELQRRVGHLDQASDSPQVSTGISTTQFSSSMQLLVIIPDYGYKNEFLSQLRS